VKGFSFVWTGTLADLLVVHRLGLQTLSHIYIYMKLFSVSCVINGANSSEGRPIKVTLIENGGERNLNSIQIWKFQYLNLSQVKRKVMLEDRIEQCLCPYLCSDFIIFF